MIGPTERQTLVLQFIAKHTAEKGYPPTIREIARSIGIRSTNGVNDHLRALEKKGLIFREDMKSRSVRLTDVGAMAADAGDSPSLARRGIVAAADDLVVCARPFVNGQPITQQETESLRRALDAYRWARHPEPSGTTNVGGESHGN